MRFNGKDFEQGVYFLITMFIVFILLGTWKLIDIIIWIINHVRVNII